MQAQTESVEADGQAQEHEDLVRDALILRLLRTCNTLTQLS
jgi:hypothetical protein